uniref:effector-associated domain EAD1-containing protein n=1 Tax=Streptomyces sp. TRM64462 TaxID=2741726 RepID=UPI00158640B9
MASADGPEPYGQDFAFPDWEIPDEDWKTLVRLLCGLYEDKDERGRLLRALGQPPEKVPFSDDTGDTFWEKIRREGRKGALGWDWKDVVRQAIRDFPYSKPMWQLALRHQLLDPPERPQPGPSDPPAGTTGQAPASGPGTEPH